MMRQILVTRPMSLELFDDLFSKDGGHQYKIDMWHDAQTDMSREEFLRRIRGTVGVLLGFGSKLRIDQESLDAAGNDLKVISIISAGYDNIDVQECKKRGILVGHTPNVLTEAVAELAVGLTLATIRRFMEANESLKQGRWICEPFWMTGSTVGGSVLGFIGAGRIGSSIMAKLKSFRPRRILYHCRNRSEPVEQQHQAEYVQQLDDLLRESDIVIVCCSLNRSTYHLLDSEQFSQMKPTSVVINISRGSIINQPALVNALQRKQIRAAGLDVMEPEPLPLDDPILKLPNVVLLPHIGSAVVETRHSMIRLALDNLKAGLENGRMPASVW